MEATFNLGLERAEEASRLASIMLKRQPKVAAEDQPAIHRLFMELLLLEYPFPALDAKIDTTGHVYDVTVRGFGYQIPIPPLVTKLRAQDCHELLKGVTKIWAQMGTKDILIGVQVCGKQGIVNTTVAKRQISDEIRNSARRWAGELVSSLQAKEEDRQWIEAVVCEALLFEQPPPKLDVVLAPVNDNYNLQLTGYKGALDLCLWANTFLGVSRNDMMVRVQHSFLQMVPEKGACIVLQMTKAEFQTAPVTMPFIKVEEEHEEKRGRSRSHSRVPSSRSRSKSHSHVRHKRYE